MSSGFEDFHADWERQREALSTLLDGELDAAERETLERHLATCAQCREEYNTLRRTRALLRAMPQPTLPRSFALPLESAPNVRSISDARSRRVGSGAFSRAAQRMGSLVAAAGLILLIGSWLASASSATHSSSSASRYAPQAGGSQNTHITTTGAPAHTAQAYAGATGGPDVGNPAATSGSASASPTTSSTRAGTSPSNDSASSIPVLPLTGAGLTVGGVLLVVAGRAAKPRQRRVG